MGNVVSELYRVSIFFITFLVVFVLAVVLFSSEDLSLTETKAGAAFLAYLITLLPSLAYSADN